MNMFKKIAYIGLLVVVGLFYTTCMYAQQAQTDDKPYKQLLVDVEGRLRTGDFVGAIEKLDDIIAKYPDAAEVYYAKALLYGQARNFDMAIPIVEKAWEIEPKNMLYANYLVELHKSKGDLAAAVPVVDRAIEALPDNESLYREKMLLLHA